MSTHNHPTLAESIVESITDCNHSLDCVLRRRVGMGVNAYKAIKATTQLAGVIAVVHAMNLGMDPGTGGLIIGSIVVGPEAVETIIANASETND